MEQNFAELKAEYGFNEPTTCGAAIGTSGIICNATCSFPIWKANEDDETFSNLELILLQWDIGRMFEKIKFVSFNDIEYFKVHGSVHYETKISGGGVNLEGAMVGAALFGSTGAIIGSNVGTEISSKTIQADDRLLMIRRKRSQQDIVIAKGCEVDEILYILRAKIPTKEYSSDNGFKYSHI